MMSDQETEYTEPTDADPPTDEPAAAEGAATDEPGQTFTVSGDVQATDEQDAYRQLGAHFAALARPGDGILEGVTVTSA